MDPLGADRQRGGAPRPGELAVALLLFGFSFFTTTTLGAGWTLWTRTDVTTDLLPWLAPATVARVWRDPALLRIGLAFSLPTLFIMLCHELGHYLACRRHGLSASLPYFLPAPLGLGTLGAFIRIRAPVRDRRQLLDVGVAGPLAGFLALLPFLVLGVWRSRVGAIELPAAGETATLSLLRPGANLALGALTLLRHGPLAAGRELDLHPFALSAWVGLLITALNLIPLGQLDGGHIFYAAVGGRRQRRVAPWLWAALAAAGLLLWPGWLLWCAVTLAMGLRHPPVAREDEPLDARRLALAWTALALLVSCFTPVPLREVLVAP